MTRQELWNRIEEKYADELKGDQWSNSIDTIKLWFNNFIDEDKIPDCMHYLDESNVLATFINTCDQANVTRNQQPQYAECGFPTLCFGLFAWLQWFRGYYYQTSHTHTGIYTEATGAYRLDALDLAISGLEDINPNLYMTINALAMLACISNMAGTHIGNDLKQEDVREAVNAFLEKTLEYTHPRVKGIPKFTVWFAKNIERTSHKDLDCLSGTSVALKTNRDNIAFALSENSICACFKYQGRYYICKLKFADYLIDALEYFDDFEYKAFIGNALQALCALLGFWTCYDAVVPDLKLDVMDLVGLEQTFCRFGDVVKYLADRHPVQK